MSDSPSLATFSPARTLSAWCLAALSLASGAAAGQARYAVTELPLLPGSAQCTATALNDLAEVVGHCAPAVEDWNQTAVVWRQGSVTALGRWPIGSYSQGSAINSFGYVAGHADEGNLRPQGWVALRNGQWVNFFPNSSGNTYPLFIGDDGWVGGYFIKGSRGNWTAAIWRPDAKDPTRYRLEAFPQLPGATNARSVASLATGFNRAGVGVGRAGHDQASRPVVWLADAKHSLQVLPDPPDGPADIAHAINDLGQIVGEGLTPGQPGNHAVFWANDGARSASLLPRLPGYNSARALALNNLGHVLGEAANYADPVTGALARDEIPVIWRDGGVFALQDLLDPATAGQLRLTKASDVNESGAIAATALRTGLKRAVLLTPKR